MNRKKRLKEILGGVALALGFMGTAIAWEVQISPFMNNFLLLGSFPIALVFCFWLYKD